MIHFPNWTWGGGGDYIIRVLKIYHCEFGEVEVDSIRTAKLLGSTVREFLSNRVRWSVDDSLHGEVGKEIDPASRCTG